VAVGNRQPQHVLPRPERQAREAAFNRAGAHDLARHIGAVDVAVVMTRPVSTSMMAN